MIERLIRSVCNSVATVAFTLLLPFFCAAAWLWGSADERWLMKVAFCILSPFCAVLWYIVASHLLWRHRSSYFAKFFVFVGSAAGVYLLLRSGVITF